jgi:hypothetical protein
MEPEDHADENGHAPLRSPPSASFGHGEDFGETTAALQPPQLTSTPLEANEECTEEGEVYEYQDEEDQGQDNQGKPPNLMHI